MRYIGALLWKVLTLISDLRRLNQRVDEWAGLQTRVRLQTRHPECRSKVTFAIGYPSEGLKAAEASRKLAGHLKMCRAGADVNSGYPGRIRAVVNLSRPHCGWSGNGDSSKNVGNARVNDNSDAGLET